MAQLQFTDSEREQLKLAAASLMKVRAKLPAKEWSRPQNKIVKLFCKKMEVDAEYYVFDRRILRMVQELCNGARSALNTTIIPEHEKRIASMPDKAEFYAAYKEKAESTEAVYRSILEKVEANL